MNAPASYFTGQNVTRIDGAAKVTGMARYPDDEPNADPAFAWLVTSAIARGRIRKIDLAEARSVPGVLDILTHENVGDEVKPPKGPDQGKTTTTLESDQIWYDGQIIAVVIANSFEAAREAGYKVQVEYDAQPPSATFGSPGVETERKIAKQQKDPEKGDAPGAFASATTKIDVEYSTPTQHHNPIELFTTTCAWDGPNLTIYEPTQGVFGLRAAVAQQLSLSQDRVRVVSRFVGGGFGS